MIGVSPSVLDASYKECYAIMKDKAVNFFHAFKYLDQSSFKAITGVYAFCRYVDDIVDENETENIETKDERLNEMMLIVNSIEDDHLNFSQKQVWYFAFKKAVLDYKISKQALLDQIEGQRNDLTFNGIESHENLVNYSTLVAGSVGRMLLPMLSDQSDDYALNVCNQLGIAMQFTNILRDIGEDFRERGRIYIPQNLLSEYSVSSDTLQALSSIDSKEYPNVSVMAMWEHLAKQAEISYDYFVENITTFNQEARMPLLLACENYRAILEAIRNQNYNCFRERCYTSKIKRVEILHNVKKMLKSVEVR